MICSLLGVGGFEKGIRGFCNCLFFVFGCNSCGWVCWYWKGCWNCICSGNCFGEKLEFWEKLDCGVSGVGCF